MPARNERKDFSKGYIYFIWSPHYWGVYVGSSCDPLSVRWDRHVKRYREWVRAGRPSVDRHGTMARFILDSGGCDDVHIVKLYDFPCANQGELEAQEYGEMAKYTNLVNKRCAAVCTDARKAQMAAYNKWCASHFGTLARSYPLFA